jgi:4-hydroxyphenylacetate 3-monooxygenase
MGARTGKEVLDRLREQPPALWVDGELVQDPTTHPRTFNAAHSLAALYELQHRPDLIDTMTFESPTSGDRVGMSFIVPRTREDLERRSEMHKVWADACLGFMGRMPDYLNVNLMGAGTAADYFGQCRPEFADNARNYFEYVRENDLALTHALTNPQVDRRKQAYELDDPFIALGVVRETSDGIIVRGARMLATLPISDEILIFPSTVVKGGDEMKPYALAFGIPNNTPGLSFQCREPLDIGRSHKDHPLGSRFDEMDAMVYFDDVLVPWERVLLMNDVDMILEIMKGLKIASEAGASLNKYGVMTPARPPLDAARNWYPGVYKRLVEIMQLVTTSGLITIPTEADFQGPRGADIAKYLQGANSSADERVALFRLAWDMSISAFGGRQSHYELFFFGDPPRMKQALYGIYDRGECVERVRSFVADTGWPQTALAD